MKATVIGVFSIVTKGLVRGLEGLEIMRPLENIQTTALSRSERMQIRTLEKNFEKVSANAGVKTSR